MEKQLKYGLQTFDTIWAHKPARIIVYAAGALVIVYLLGKSLSVVASAVRGYNDLKNALST